MNCVKSVRFAVVVINDKPDRYFSLLGAFDREIPYHPPGGHLLSHLLFADDTLLFLKANVHNCHNITRILHDFYHASGQQVSLEKSSVYFSSNTSDLIPSSLSGILHMPIVTDPGKYLGLPTIWGQAKKDALGFVKDKIQLKAARETLIKVVALAVPTYLMNIFLFPNSLCKEINSILANF
ncbi:unnamed protein product [Prunus armeniaca]